MCAAALGSGAVDDSLIWLEPLFMVNFCLHAQQYAINAQLKALGPTCCG